MESMVSRWKSAIQQSQSKQSRLQTHPHKIEESRDLSAQKSKESKLVSAQKSRKASTPNKAKIPVNSRVDICAMAILDLTQSANPEKTRLKIKALLEDLLQNTQVEKETSATRMSQKAFIDLQNRFIESEKERQYLKGKDQLHIKRVDALERQLSHYARMEHMLEAAVAKQSSLIETMNQLRKDKAELQKRLKDQQSGFSKEVVSIRQLVDSLKEMLPTS